MKIKFALAVAVCFFGLSAYAEENELKLDDEPTAPPEKAEKEKKDTGDEEPQWVKEKSKAQKEAEEKTASKKKAKKEDKEEEEETEEASEAEEKKEPEPETAADYVPWVSEEGAPKAPGKEELEWYGDLSMRFRSQLKNNLTDFNGDRYDFDYPFGQRIRGTIGTTYKNTLSARISLQDARIWGDENSQGEENLWQNDLAKGYGTTIHEGYFELNRPFGIPFIFKVGRMELSFGSESIIGHDDWNLVGNSFDAVLAMLTIKSVDITTFYSRMKPQEFIRHPVGPCSQNDYRLGCMAYGEDLGGFDVKLKAVKDLEGEFYTFYQRTSPGNDGPYSADDRILWTIGIFAKNPENSEPIYLVELDFQFGKVPSIVYGADVESHTAFALILEGGYNFLNVYPKPKFSLRYSFATGDDKPAPNDDVSSKFYQLYPSNHEVLGLMDLKDLSNVHDLSAKFSAVPRKDLSAGLELHLLLQQKYRDAWTDAQGQVVGKSIAPGFTAFYGEYDPTGNSGLSLGQETDLFARWDAFEHFYLLCETGLFIPLSFPKNVAEQSNNLDSYNRALLGNSPAWLLSLTAGLDF